MTGEKNFVTITFGISDSPVRSTESNVRVELVAAQQQQQLGRRQKGNGDGNDSRVGKRDRRHKSRERSKQQVATRRGRHIRMKQNTRGAER